MIPAYLRKKRTSNGVSSNLSSETAQYMPLLGTWLIDIALSLEWHKPSNFREYSKILSDPDFCTMTGMKPIYDDDGDDQPKHISATHCRKLLLKQRKQLQQMKMPEHLPLFKNIEMMAELIGLTESDKIVLTFAVALNISPEFTNAIGIRHTHISTIAFCQLLAELTGIKQSDLICSVSKNSPLITSGLINIDRSNCYLVDKIAVIDSLEDVFQMDHENVEELVNCFMRLASPPSLTLNNFPHMHKESDLLKGYLGNAIAQKISGVNIMFHGKPGVGKNEFVQALAEELNVGLYEVLYADKDGDPITGKARLRVYALCQRLLTRSSNAMLMFDEAEDVFGSGNNFSSKMFGGGDRQTESRCNGKAWINRTLENNPVPAIWISNRVEQIDTAFLRRFDYSVSFPLPPRSVRITIARHHLGCFEPPQAWIERLAGNEAILPAQLERAAKVANIACAGDNKRALELAEQTLERSITLLGQRRTPCRNPLLTGYSLEWLNTDIEIEKLVERLKRKPNGTFCFYGAAGTGKSELARYMADQVGKQMILKRASDILSKWVGESEQNIAAIFAEARQQDAVLLLDEADSFLADRRDAQRSWEVTQVNELLTQMEAFEGIFICTTNLMSKLDQASLRRFAFKVRFDPLKSGQRIALFRQELVRLGGKASDNMGWEQQLIKLEQLTPGDFAVAARQFELWDEPATPDRLYDVLKKECAAKGLQPGKIGFGV